jgi:GH15 family glucan-1,4-alpha-glucosidase
LDLRNDVGLLSEQWDPDANRQLGNTPQAFSHFALINSALLLHHGGAEHINKSVGAPPKMSGSGR